MTSVRTRSKLAFVLSTVVLSTILAAIAFVAGAPPLCAEERSDEKFLRQLDEAVARGEITREFALQNKFYYVFEPEAVDARFRVEEPAPMKCATHIIVEYLEMRDASELSIGVAGQLQSYLDRSDPNIAAGKDDPDMRTLAVYDSPGGFFRLTYFTTGTNAVPVADIDPLNGVPDFVEWCASYCDSSWQREIFELGFMAPQLDLSGKYQVGFEAMGAYGYCTTNGQGGTRLVLHRNFLGFPPNSDPDGDQKGAAKATVAHEFKHASQYQGSFWTEGNWVELDATWCEDAVFDSTNDYYNFIQSGNGIRAPQTSLDAGGGGLYEDCIWERYMTDTYGDSIIYEIWERRKTNQAENMKVTYDMVLQNFGSSFTLAYEEFMEWCYLSGVRASSELTGFRERFGYPNSTINQTWTTLPATRSTTIPRNAGNFLLVNNTAGAMTGRPRLVFTSAAGTPLQLRLIYHFDNGTDGHAEVALDSLGAADLYLSTWFDDLAQLGIIVINPKRDGAAADAYSLAISSEALTDVPGGRENSGSMPAVFSLEQNSPNPVVSRTAFRFQLPQEAEVHFGVYDLAGRLVATLASGAALRPGAHEIVWNGRNDAGGDVASGIYAYKIVAGNFTETKKLTLVR
jgi:hypothetical protein